MYTQKACELGLSVGVYAYVYSKCANVALHCLLRSSAVHSHSHFLFHNGNDSLSNDS